MNAQDLYKLNPFAAKHRQTDKLTTFPDGKTHEEVSSPCITDSNAILTSQQHFYGAGGERPIEDLAR